MFVLLSICHTGGAAVCGSALKSAHLSLSRDSVRAQHQCSGLTGTQKLETTLLLTGIKVGGQNINNLRYADDTVLITENKEDLQKLLNIVEEESRKKGLELNSNKTEVMVISRKQESPKCDIFINEVKLKQTEKFKHLGTIISNDGKTNREISARTAQAQINFQKMKTIRTNKHISIETRKRALQCYIEPVLISRGRQREKIMDGLATWLGTGKVLDTLTAVKDRDLWRDMITNAYKQGT
ncbi:endonuclease-reverse transcriptase [Plakobranchus ocellatus]|uniref:Endonuclease-reverse transcriptase n=1 Tax=Plakobranchus ocellatus TaxID=259542 RepID=A0AAV3Z806_9GAST|nr:endonuclease-reverse transcriptase [Plakobranchus ocellatus]